MAASRPPGPPCPWPRPGSSSPTRRTTMSTASPAPSPPEPPGRGNPFPEPGGACPFVSQIFPANPGPDGRGLHPVHGSGPFSPSKHYRKTRKERFAFFPCLCYDNGACKKCPARRPAADAGRRLHTGYRGLRRILFRRSSGTEKMARRCLLRPCAKDAPKKILPPRVPRGYEAPPAGQTVSCASCKRPGPANCCLKRGSIF